MDNYLKPLVHSLIEWIEEHLQNNINISTIAKKSGYSKRYIQSIFKEVIGVSIGEYIRIRRLTKSAMLVLFTKKRIEHIANELNYSSIQSFTRAFKRHFNQSPSSFRKKDTLDCSKLLINKSLNIEGGGGEIVFDKIFSVKGRCIVHKELLISGNSIRKNTLRMKEIIKYRDKTIYIISRLIPYSMDSWDLNISSVIGTSDCHGDTYLKFKKCVILEYVGSWHSYPTISRNIFNMLDMKVYPYCIVEEIKFYHTKSEIVTINIYIEIE